MNVHCPWRDFVVTSPAWLRLLDSISTITLAKRYRLNQTLSHICDGAHGSSGTYIPNYEASNIPPPRPTAYPGELGSP